MRAGYSILIFPGGGREVMKRKGEQYQLIWKERYGFLRLAQQFQYDIVPFAAYGGDHVFDIRCDANDLLQHPWIQKLFQVPAIRQFLREGEAIPSLPRYPWPKRIPLSFKFLPTVKAPAAQLNDEALKAYRDGLQQAIYAALEDFKKLKK